MQTANQINEQIERLRAKLATAEADHATAQEKLDAVAFDAEAGDAKAERLRDRTLAAMRDASDTVAATAAAIRGAERALAAAQDAEAADQESQRRQAICELAEQRLKVAATIDAALVALKPTVVEYRTLGSQIEKLAGGVSHQLTSPWRLEAAIDFCFAIGGSGVQLRKPLLEHERGLLARFIAADTSKKAA